MERGKYEHSRQPAHRRRRRRRMNPTFPVFVLMVLALVIGLCTLVLRGCSADSGEKFAAVSAALKPGNGWLNSHSSKLRISFPDLTDDPEVDPEDPDAEVQDDQVEDPTEETTEETTGETEEDSTEDLAPPPPGTLGQQIADVAAEQIGKPFELGGSGPDTFDTTGFIFYCHQQAGLTVPRWLDDQASFGAEVPTQDDLLPGDVIFFWTDTPGQCEYPAIYVGNGKFIAARRTDQPVCEMELSIPYYAERYVTARRFS